MFDEGAYRDVLNLVQRLSTDEQFQLLEDLVAALRKESQPQPSTLELEGLGREREGASLSEKVYRIVFNQIRQLSTDGQFRMIGDLAVLLQKGITREPEHSITELEGLGKEIWEGVDVEEYIRQSRGPHLTENDELTGKRD